jgi:hypothetical protein
VSAATASSLTQNQDPDEIGLRAEVVSVELFVSVSVPDRLNKPAKYHQGNLRGANKQIQAAAAADLPRSLYLI